MERERSAVRAWMGRVLQVALALAAAGGLSFLFFLTLPLLQRMGQSRESKLEVRSVETAALPPPPPPVEEEREEEKKSEEAPPADLTEQAAPPLDLSQLEMALDPGMGEGGWGGVAANRLTQSSSADAEREREAESVFSMADLDQAPRVVNQPPPQYPAEVKARKLRGTVHVMFVVDRSGRVIKPVVQKATHPAFEKPALEAVRRWRFEPGKRGGQAVQFRMRVPISFESG